MWWFWSYIGFSIGIKLHLMWYWKVSHLMTLAETYMNDIGFSKVTFLSVLSVGPVEESPTCLSTSWALGSHTLGWVAARPCPGLRRDLQTSTSRSSQNTPLNCPSPTVTHSLKSFLLSWIVNKYVHFCWTDLFCFLISQNIWTKHSVEKNNKA